MVIFNIHGCCELGYLKLELVIVKLIRAKRIDYLNYREFVISLSIYNLEYLSLNPVISHAFYGRGLEYIN